MTAYGMLISAFTRTQIAALFGTSILTVLPATQFSGMMTPGLFARRRARRSIGRAFPMTYFMPISVGAFTKGLGFADLVLNLVALGAVHSRADAAQLVCCCGNRSGRP